MLAARQLFKQDVVWRGAALEESAVQRAFELQLEGGGAVVFTSEGEFPAIGFDQVQRPKEPYGRNAGIGRGNVLDLPFPNGRGQVDNLCTFQGHELVYSLDL